MIKFPKFKFLGIGQKNNEGPPDLDEVLRDLSQKINNIFGKKSGGNNGNSDGSQPAGNRGFDVPILPILALIAAIWLATGFYIVKEGSVGVEQRFGAYTISTDKSGAHWHWPFPIESAEVVNMEQVRRVEVGYRSSEDGSGSKQKISDEALMLTEDENIIDMQVAVQYKLKNAVDFLYSNRDSEKAVRSAAESAIREVVGKSKLDDLIVVGLPETSERMQSILDNYKTGILITSVSRQKGAAPEQVKEAFDDVNRAQQDYQRLINEGQSYANEVVPKARGNASRLAAEAAGYKLKVESEATGNASRFEQILTQYNKAPEVTRQRLYLDAQEQIMSNTSKVLVDQKGGNSLLYLPLDKLMATTSAASAATAATSVNNRENEAVPVDARELSRDRSAR
jgi:modulator of FtsH protease HflK